MTALYHPALLLLILSLSIPAHAAEPMHYRLESQSTASPVESRFTPSQIAILEKLNRADRTHLARLSTLVIPERWSDNEIDYSPLPATYEASRPFDKFIVIDVPSQSFGAYERGRLIRWGPVSSGDHHDTTDEGWYHLNWKAPVHVSTVNPDWVMPWTFNFNNRTGCALHSYSLPGTPASHGCVRLLDRDARWIYEWADTWKLTPDGGSVLAQGTSLWIVGQYNFTDSPPWRSLAWLAALPISLPRVLPTAAEEGNSSHVSGSGPVSIPCETTCAGHLSMGRRRCLMSSSTRVPAEYLRPEDESRRILEGDPSRTDEFGGAPVNSDAFDRSTIAGRAYSLWLSRGCPDGSPEEDWYRAEQEIAAESSGRNRDR